MQVRFSDAHESVFDADALLAEALDARAPFHLPARQLWSAADMPREKLYFPFGDIGGDAAGQFLLF